MTRPGLLIIWLMLACSCADGDDARPLLFDVGDPCRSAIQYCVDDTTVQRCVDDVWTLTACDDVCGELGPAYVSDGCENECSCVLADPLGCVPDDTACTGNDSVNICTETQEWQSLVCTEVCADIGLKSLGCIADDDEEDCWCTVEGTPCESSASPACVDAMTLAQCIAGTWVFEDCTQQCQESAQCVAWGDPPFCGC